MAARPLRRSLLSAVGAAVLAAVPASAASGPDALVALPPGEGNTITLGAFAANQASGDCGDLGPHVCDQLAMYRDWRFRDARLAASPGDVAGAVSRESPRPGVVIVRDRFGVPHVFGDGPTEQAIRERLAYGVGYAQAEERLFQMEVLRRAAEGTLSELLGRPYLEMDYLTLRDTETDAERAQQLATLSPGDSAALDSYVDGVNAVIAHDTANPAGMPAGFTLLQDLPIRPFTANDVLATLTLEVRNVAESAGNELGYGSLGRRLASRFGDGEAARILDDVQLTGDPESPTTVPPGGAARRTTDGHHYGFTSYTRADTARLIGRLGPSVEAAHADQLTGAQALADADSSLGLPVFGSNAWAISPERSRTGGALLWGGPQVGYYVPPVFDELEIEGGGLAVRGVGVPGSGPGVAIGFTPSTAWTITTAQDDQVDTYVDRIRRASGGGYEYRWHGAWRPVAERTATIRVRDQTPELPLTGQLGAPTYHDETVTLYRTFHGPVSDPLPCAVVHLDADAGLSYCRVRAFWNSELQTGLSLVGVNRARDLGQFQAAVRQGVAGFNFIYADADGHIGYWHTGRIPIRAAGHDPRLPVPGGGRYDWRGFLDPRQWPSVVDPAQGYLASWNNKPQRSWLDSGDGSLWGGNQRVGEPMSLLAGHGTPVGQNGLWRIARRTGELDLRAKLGFRRYLTGLASHFDLTPTESAAVTEVAGWDGTAFFPDGAERDPSGAPTGNVAGAAFPIFDAWFAALEDRVADPLFGPVDDRPGAAGLRHFTQTPQTTSPRYEFFDDYDAFLFDVMSGRAGAADYLDGRSPWQVSRDALDDAIAKLTAAQGPDPASWRSPMPRIRFTGLDVSDIGTIPWENRGTWGQAIALP